MGEFFLFRVKTKMNCYYYHIINQIEYTTNGSVLCYQAERHEPKPDTHGKNNDLQLL
jgi:hypothetical protein